MLDVVPGQGGSPILGGSPVSTARGCEQPQAPFQCDPEESRSVGQPWASCPLGVPPSQKGQGPHCAVTVSS